MSKFSDEFKRHRAEHRKQVLQSHKASRQALLDQYEGVPLQERCKVTATNGFSISSLNDHELILILEYMRQLQLERQMESMSIKTKAKKKSVPKTTQEDVSLPCV